MDNSNKLIKKIVALVELESLSPFIIGTGSKMENIDIPILRDNENNPYIPATSFAGSVRSFLSDCIFDNKDTMINHFFGYTTKDKNLNDEALQSALKVFDLNLSDKTKYTIAKRTGIKIDLKTNITMDKMKMDYELVEQGACFQLEMELTIRQDQYEQELTRMFFTILKLLQEAKISFGAFRTKGFGRFKAQQIKYRVYDFIHQDEGFEWILRQDNYNIHDDLGPKWKSNFDNMNFLDLKYPESININAWFSLKNSLLIKQNSPDFTSPDTTHIQSNGLPVIPGSSLKGALRHRAEKICNFVFKDKIKTKELMNWCFGNIVEKKNNMDTLEIKKDSMSNITVEERLVDSNNIAMEIQNRIQIDRFTGGAANTALFDTVPLWAKNNERVVNMEFSITNKNCSNNFKAGAGILLLLLKDIWTEDLPIGGEKSIGRGIVSGLESTITIYKDGEEKHIKISNGDGKLIFSSPDFEKSENARNELQRYVDKFINWNREERV